MLYYLYNILYDFFYTQTSVNEIIPGLWLGNYKAALDIDFLKENKIDLIINCTPSLPFANEMYSKKELGNLKLETYRIPVNDSLLERDFILMEKYFKIVIPMLLRKYIIENKRILIHCHMGKQRSAILTAALLKVLVDKNYITLHEIPNYRNVKQFEYICNYLLSKRPQVFTYGLRINFEPTYKRFFKIK